MGHGHALTGAVTLHVESIFWSITMSLVIVGRQMNRTLKLAAVTLNVQDYMVAFRLRFLKFYPHSILLEMINWLVVNCPDDVPCKQN